MRLHGGGADAATYIDDVPLSESRLRRAWPTCTDVGEAGQHVATTVARRDGGRADGNDRPATCAEAEQASELHSWRQRCEERWRRRREEEWTIHK